MTDRNEPTKQAQGRTPRPIDVPVSTPDEERLPIGEGCYTARVLPAAD